ncbi:aminotransferase class IV, partial [Candidatus Kaiserbacteria bacterium]|nr:aminotransferase class IV [Candidatus Kaiserbacteria bacterium]
MDDTQSTIITSPTVDSVVSGMSSKATAHCYLNGKIMPVDEAKVSIKDIGLLRGFGIYEAMATANRKPFMFADHMARYRRTADELHLKIPASEDEILAAINDLIERNVPAGAEATIKFFVTGGTAIHGIEYDYETPTFYMLVDPLVPFDPHYYTDGASVTVFEHLRQFPQLKTTNYIQAVMLQQARKDAGSIEILYTWGGKVLECATSNFMIVKGGKIITAKDNILFGITRKVALDVARPLFTIEEREVSVEELYAADEA